MSRDLQKSLQLLNQHFDEIDSKFGVKKLGIFGSVARGEGTSRSDIDVLVEFYKPVGFFKFIELENFLTGLLKKKVDLVTKNALKTTIKPIILKEVIYV